MNVSTSECNNYFHCVKLRLEALPENSQSTYRGTWERGTCIAEDPILHAIMVRMCLTQVKGENPSLQRDTLETLNNHATESGVFGNIADPYSAVQDNLSVITGLDQNRDNTKV